MAYPTILGWTQTPVGSFSTTEASKAISVPATTSATDTQVIALAMVGAVFSATLTGGWTSVGSGSVGSTSRFFIFRRTGVYSAGTVTASFFDGFGAAVSVKGIVQALAVSGNLDASAFATNTSYTSTQTAPTVTAVGAETLWVQLISTGDQPRQLLNPGDVTLVTTNSTTNGHEYVVGNAVGTKQVSSGATGVSNTWTVRDQDFPSSTTFDTAQAVTASLVFSITTSSPTLSGEDTLPQLLDTGVTGSLAVLLDPVTLAADSTLDNAGVLDQSLNSLSIQALGEVPLAATITYPDSTLSANKRGGFNRGQGGPTTSTGVGCTFFKPCPDCVCYRCSPGEGKKGFNRGSNTETGVDISQCTTLELCPTCGLYRCCL